MKSVARCMLFSLLIATFQSAVLGGAYFLPAMPDLMLIFITFAALRLDGIAAMSVAFLSGLLLDCISTAPLGLHSLCYVPSAFFISSVSPIISKDSVFIVILSNASAFFAKVAMTFVVSVFFSGIVVPYDVFSVPFCFEFAFNVLFAPLFFKYFSRFEKFLAAKKFGVE